jgi:hypothetical protein
MLLVNRYNIRCTSFSFDQRSILFIFVHYHYRFVFHNRWDLCHHSLKRDQCDIAFLLRKETADADRNWCILAVSVEMEKSFLKDKHGSTFFIACTLGMTSSSQWISILHMRVSVEMTRLSIDCLVIWIHWILTALPECKPIIPCSIDGWIHWYVHCGRRIWEVRICCFYYIECNTKHHNVDTSEHKRTCERLYKQEKKGKEERNTSENSHN